MKKKSKIARFFGHLHTVNKHRRLVRRLCFKCGLYKQGLFHDLSKYSPVEFFNGVKYYTGTASPHVGERKEKGYSDAWLHHKGRNKHHLEYWVDGKPVEMPLNYFIEMLCDRIAASKTYLKINYQDSSPLEYYNSHRDENPFNENTRFMLEDMLHFLATNGEYSFFQYLKMMYKVYKKTGKII